MAESTKTKKTISTKQNVTKKVIQDDSDEEQPVQQKQVKKMDKPDKSDKQLDKPEIVVKKMKQTKTEPEDSEHEHKPDNENKKFVKKVKAKSEPENDKHSDSDHEHKPEPENNKPKKVKKVEQETDKNSESEQEHQAKKITKTDKQTRQVNSDVEQEVKKPKKTKEPELIPESDSEAESEEYIPKAKTVKTKKTIDDESSIGSQNKNKQEGEIETMVRAGCSIKKISESLGKDEQAVKFMLRKMVYAVDGDLQKKIQNLMEGKANEQIKYNTEKLYTDQKLVNMLTIYNYIERNCGNDPKLKDLCNQIKNECTQKVSMIL